MSARTRSLFFACAVGLIILALLASHSADSALHLSIKSALINPVATTTTTTTTTTTPTTTTTTEVLVAEEAVPPITVRPTTTTQVETPVSNGIAAETIDPTDPNRCYCAADWQATGEVNGMPCGGLLPPCYAEARESKGDPAIWNGGCYAPAGWEGTYSPCGGSNASGLWQFMRDTWAHYGGYLNAADAPWWVQNDRAAEVWNHGRGCSNWSAC